MSNFPMETESVDVTEPMLVPQRPESHAGNTRICSRCICDTTFPNISFDDGGVCNFCKAHGRLERAFPLNDESARKVEKIVAQAKRHGAKKKWDCVVGVSGGRDSTYLLHLLTKKYGLRPLAVHFNDGFGNPTAGENMTRATSKLGVELRFITSDWRESKDLKIAFLKSSTPDLEQGTDIGAFACLYGEAAKEGLKHVFVGHSFRTEGISPLSWNYLDGKYLKEVHSEFGTVPLRPWAPGNPGFNLEPRHVAYYAIYRGIRVVSPFYYLPYVRSDVDQIITNELGWVNPGAHYFDDLYQSLMTFVFRTKFDMDRRKFNYSALVRSGQMSREEAIEKVREIYAIEDPKVIDLCIKRLGLTHGQFDEMIAAPAKTFRDYRTSYDLIKLCRLPIWVLTKIGLLPGTTYAKYFECA